ncbi:hypothetical protein LEMLEM_LOCUS15955, partial [Lemmus lemmus]
ELVGAAIAKTQALQKQSGHHLDFQHLRSRRRYKAVGCIVPLRS